MKWDAINEITKRSDKLHKLLAFNTYYIPIRLETNRLQKLIKPVAGQNLSYTTKPSITKYFKNETGR